MPEPRASVDWDARFMSLCLHISKWSKDPNTKYGAIIVGPRKRIASVGYNGFPRGLDDSKVKRYMRPDKYLWIEHAERNAIYNAAEPLVGYTLYVNGPPCAQCASAIVQSGIIRVVMKPHRFGHERSERQAKTEDVAREMMEEAKVAVFTL